MATVNRPPFWVPRPPDDNIWGWVPPRGALTLATTELKWYGAPGQVPTKYWLPYYTLNDPPEWQGAPTHSQSLVLTTTELKWYGAPGQVPTKRWGPHYIYDDPSVAYYPRIEWMNSAIIQMLTHQSFFGAGGQVPTKRWVPYFWDDISPAWEYNVNWLNSAIIQILTQQKIFGAGGQVPPSRWNFNYDETPPWQLNINWMNSAAIQILTQQKIFGQGGQVPPSRWNFNYDETPLWQFSYPRNPNTITVQNNPFSPVVWRFDYDDSPMWQGRPIATNVNFIPINMPRAAFWSLRAGFESEWYGAPIAISSLNVPQLTKPFAPQLWKFDYSFDTEWYGKPVAISALNVPQHSPFVPRFWNFDYDDPPMWQGSPVAIPVLNVPQANLKIIPRFWNFNYDDPPMWQGRPVATNVNFIPVNMLRASFYALKPGEEHYWQLAIQRNNVILVPTTTKPLVPVIQQFYDEPIGWTGHSIASNINFFPFLIPASALWVQSVGFDTEWVGSPIGVGASRLPVLPPVNVHNIYRWGIFLSYDVMGEPLWQGKPTPAYSVNIPGPPVIRSLFPDWLIRARRRGIR